MPEERATRERVDPAAEAAAMESVQEPSVPSVEGQARRARPGGAPRGRLSPEQEREVARLYAEGSLPTSAIRQRFDIGESSLYRIVQRHGLPRRGRAASSTPPGPPQAQAPDRRRRTTAARGAQPAGAPPRSTTGRPSRGPTRRGAQTEPTPARAQPPAARREGGRPRFRVAFQGEVVVEAQDIRDALRQVEALGATEIVAVAREA